MRPLLDCLNPLLRDLFQRADALKAQNAMLQRHLPESLRGHCRVASLHRGVMTLITDNATWATPLRYALPSLRDALRQHEKLYQLTSIQIRVEEPQPVSNVTKKMPSGLPEPAREALQSIAADCTHAPLRSALRRLAGKKEE
ncbi:hypothetical protein Lgee_1236 [Legionella geestiana]|uniref:Uncharacterized protein n=1 Tax=Legionella geestiana TaxID=45065 RepID=A0A0W0TUD1_9GAMM|nr:DUF721 domain-containing protein [Legionella geestiana]KTC99298.1 hypothetical protein Lgee_1236 [Legionella geestiana]QBS11988.1 DUF721 domain-containing protein [Legionella geestiana]QDQ40402.1 DUF721 domain-containing protein [Legionella geestiana]STX53298.1 Zn-ribbon-containing, possible RNA-binding protein-like protein [Legionella geestiana]